MEMYEQGQKLSCTGQLVFITINHDTKKTKYVPKKTK